MHYREHVMRLWQMIKLSATEVLQILCSLFLLFHHQDGDQMTQVALKDFHGVSNSLSSLNTGYSQIQEYYDGINNAHISETRSRFVAVGCIY